MTTRWTYHPFEVAVAGMSGSGKTTLIERLIRKLAERHVVGYAKHGAHAMDLDRPGKDTFRAARAGAATVLIETDGTYGVVGAGGAPSALDRARLLYDCDMVLVEGMKYGHTAKLVMLDDGGEALRQVEAGKITNVLGFVCERPGAGGQSGAQDLLGKPCIDRDDVERITRLIEEHVLRVARAPLFGLVLAGGYSERMGRDKWAMEYVSGETQLDRTAELLASVCKEVRISVRPEQELPVVPGAPQLEDAFPFRGPLSGLLSAMHAEPGAAWLVAACDLPLLSTPTAHDLVQRRNPLRLATAYNSARDGLPEPLFAIWEPRSRQRVFDALGRGLRCPRRILMQSRPELLTLPEARALDNANTPEEAEAMRQVLRT